MSERSERRAGADLKQGTERSGVTEVQIRSYMRYHRVYKNLVATSDTGLGASSDDTLIIETGLLIVESGI